MKKIFLHIILIIVAYTVTAQNYNWDSSNFIDPNDGPSLICFMDISETDEKVVLGYFNNSLTIDSETIISTKPVGIFIAKYNESDDLLWLKTIAEGEEYAPISFMPIFSNTPTVKIDGNGNILIGLNYHATLVEETLPLVFNEDCSFYSNFIVLKLDSNGNLQSTISFDNICSMNVDFKGIATDQFENIYISGFAFNSPNIPNPLDSCHFIVGSDTLFIEEGTPFWQSLILVV